MTDESGARDERESASHHVHTKRCYWDFRQCGWVCRPAAESVELVREGT